MAGTPRVIVNTRLSPNAVALIDALAQAEDRTRSDMIRILLKEALEARSGGKAPAKDAGAQKPPRGTGRVYPPAR